MSILLKYQNYIITGLFILNGLFFVYQYHKATKLAEIPTPKEETSTPQKPKPTQKFSLKKRAQSIKIIDEKLSPVAPSFGASFSPVSALDLHELKDQELKKAYDALKSQWKTTPLLFNIYGDWIIHSYQKIKIPFNGVVLACSNKLLHERFPKPKVLIYLPMEKSAELREALTLDSVKPRIDFKENGRETLSINSLNLFLFKKEIIEHQTYFHAIYLDDDVEIGNEKYLLDTAMPVPKVADKSTTYYANQWPRHILSKVKYLDEKSQLSDFVYCSFIVDKRISQKEYAVQILGLENEATDLSAVIRFIIAPNIEFEAGKGYKVGMAEPLQIIARKNNKFALLYRTKNISKKIMKR